MAGKNEVTMQDVNRIIDQLYDGSKKNLELDVLEKLESPRIPSETLKKNFSIEAYLENPDRWDNGRGVMQGLLSQAKHSKLMEEKALRENPSGEILEPAFKVPSDLVAKSGNIADKINIMASETPNPSEMPQKTTTPKVELSVFQAVLGTTAEKRILPEISKENIDKFEADYTKHFSEPYNKRYDKDGTFTVVVDGNKIEVPIKAEQTPLTSGDSRIVSEYNQIASTALLWKQTLEGFQTSVQIENEKFTAAQKQGGQNLYNAVQSTNNEAARFEDWLGKAGATSLPTALQDQLNTMKPLSMTKTVEISGFLGTSLAENKSPQIDEAVNPGMIFTPSATPKVGRSTGGTISV